MYYYDGHNEEAYKEYPDIDIFDCERLIPFKNREMDVNASGIVATTKKGKWDKGERLRRLETMQIKEAERTDNGFVATVVDGGGAISSFEMKGGSFTLKTSWGSCVTVKSVNQPIDEVTDLKMVLGSILKIFTDLVKDESPMELVDVHIENIAFSKGVLDISETAIPTAA